MPGKNTGQFHYTSLIMSEDQRDKYIHHKLSPEEHKQVESSMSSTKQDQESIAVELGVRDAIEEIERVKIKATVENFEKQGSPYSSRPVRKYLAIAASLALLIMAGIWILTPSASNEELYLAYYQKYPNNLTPITRSDDQGVDLRSEGLKNYERGKYTAAITNFQDYLEKSNDHGTRLYLGLSLLEAGNSVEAVNVLQDVVESKDSLLLEPAQWYLALAHLKNNNIESAKSGLLGIVNEKGSFQKKAQTLLYQL